MYRFRIYLQEKLDFKELCLDAIVKEDRSYEVFYSWGPLYENLLKEGLDHALSIVYIDPKTNEKKIETIEAAETTQEILKITSGFVRSWYNLNAQIDKLKEDG